MLSSKDLKLLRKLKQRKFRSESDYFIAEGKKLCLDIWNYRSDIVEFIYLIDDKNLSEFNVVTNNKKKIISLSELKDISQTKNSQGVLALCRKFRYDIPKKIEGISFYLCDIQDPGNVGSIIRTCAWFGIKNIFCSSRTADFFHPKVIQASMGGFLFCYMHEVNIEDLIKKKCFENIFRSDMNGTPIQKVKKGNYLILLGNEGNGYSDEIIRKIPNAISVLGTSSIKPESLNVAVTCGIICHSLTNEN